MSTTLDLLRAEQAAQATKEARAPVDSVDGARTFILMEKPAAFDNVALELCWVGAKEYEKSWRADLINRADEQDFEVVSAALNSVDPARRGKCVFVLTIWKSRDESLNAINFRSGFTYRFDKVHSLKLNYGNPVGCMQIRERLRAVPLPPLGFEASLQPRESTQEADATIESTPPREPADLPKTAFPTSAKRKLPQGDDEGDEEGDKTNELAPAVPTKKTRKSCAKALRFVSPTKKAGTK